MLALETLRREIGCLLGVKEIVVMEFNAVNPCDDPTHSERKAQISTRPAKDKNESFRGVNVGISCRGFGIDFTGLDSATKRLYHVEGDGQLYRDAASGESWRVHMLKIRILDEENRETHVLRRYVSGFVDREFGASNASFPCEDMVLPRNRMSKLRKTLP